MQRSLKAANGQIIIFIDEIHSILGGGAEGGLGSIADALKPALARGDFPCIGATTRAEYRYIERDPALTRRFTPIWLREPDIAEAISIVTKVANGRLAKHHNVTFTPEAISASVEQSDQHLRNEYLPGKAIKVLDEAASNIAFGGSLTGHNQQAVQSGSVTADGVLQIIAARIGTSIEELGKTNRPDRDRIEDKLGERIEGWKKV